jgi:hypothetical protein
LCNKISSHKPLGSYWGPEYPLKKHLIEAINVNVSIFVEIVDRTIREKLN